MMGYMSAKKILHHINSLPFPLTIKHYFAFDSATALLKDGVLNSVESWDALRQSHPHFSISENRDEWLRAAEAQVKKDGQDGALPVRAKEVVRIIDELGVQTLFSAGVGGAGLEYQIKKLKPALRLICSEYSTVSVNVLRKVFLECDSILLFDMKSKDWSIALENADARTQLVLLNRIDIDLSNDELRDMFRHMCDFGIRNILIILCGRITARGLLNRIYQRMLWRLRGVPYAFAGYLRTKSTFPLFWRGLYQSSDIELPYMSGFLLKKIER